MKKEKVEVLKKACKVARGLAIDAIHKCSSGHLGLPLGATEIGASLFGDIMNFNPEDDRWLNRDRFILSAGHGSMFLYSWLFLSKYNLSLDDIKNFRTLHSKTPGHPEFRETEGVEATTGPLGQGIGNAVGFAMSGKMARTKFNTDKHKIFDNFVYCLAGDGCMQEGVASEACSFAGHNELDNLILIYDANDVTLDAMAKLTQSEDTAKRFRAYGWYVYTVEKGNDIEEVHRIINNAKRNKNGKPKLVIVKTLIGKGIEEVAGTAKAHGEGGIKFADKARKNLGLPSELFYTDKEVDKYFEIRKKTLIGRYNKWQKKFAEWKDENEYLAKLLEDQSVNYDDLLSKVPNNEGGSEATRVSSGKVLQEFAKINPLFITGSADLFGSTKNYLAGEGDFLANNFDNRNIWFGIREHAMGAMMNGIAYDGIFHVSGATFTVFADYLRPSIRLASMTQLPLTYIFTHDSVAVGEDGPTHQPVETVSSLRIIPGLTVIRPADYDETAGAWTYALIMKKPIAIILSRQNLPKIDTVSSEVKMKSVAKGAYIALRESGELKNIIIATGSELHLAIEVGKEIAGTRVVSMPSMEIFEEQEKNYKNEILPSSCKNRYAIEAGIGALWRKYIDSDDKIVSINRFGLSAPANEVLSELGISKENIIKIIKN